MKFGELWPIHLLSLAHTPCFSSLIFDYNVRQAYGSLQKAGKRLFFFCKIWCFPSKHWLLSWETAAWESGKRTFDSEPGFGPVTLELEEVVFEGVTNQNVFGLRSSDPAVLARNIAELEKATLNHRLVFSCANAGPRFCSAQ